MLPAETPRGWLFHEVRLEPQGLATWLPLHADRRENRVESEPNDVRDMATRFDVPATLHGVLDPVTDQGATPRASRRAR